MAGFFRLRRASALALIAACATAAPAPHAAAAEPACGPNDSVVLQRCARPESPGRADAGLREKLDRNARRLQKRAELSPSAADLGTVIIEEQRLLEPSDLERFRATLTRKDYPLGRNTYGGLRGDRDNFGLRHECGQSWDLMCADQAGRPATAHWMNGR